jgi:hypothetical protein
MVSMHEHDNLRQPAGASLSLIAPTGASTAGTRCRGHAPIRAADAKQKIRNAALQRQSQSAIIHPSLIILRRQGTYAAPGLPAALLAARI